MGRACCTFHFELIFSSYRAGARNEYWFLQSSKLNLEKWMHLKEKFI